MSQRFSDDNFIEAAKIYRQIQAPSGLREKVTAGVYAAETVRKTEKRPYGKIYRLGSIAACAAVMVLSLQFWGPDGSMTASLLGEGVQNPDQQLQPANELVRMAEPPADEDFSPADEQPEAASYSRDTDEPAAYSAVPDEMDFDVQPLRMENEAETEEEAEAETDELEGLQEFVEKRPEAVSVSSLLPAMLGNESVLSGWEVRLVNAEDGACTVEITAEEQNVSSMVTVSKSDENGQWQIESAEKTYYLKNQ